ncbi:MAG: 2-C-methyl-D-erythritol 2,4-cyclodiphosphate synthase [Chitinivibrionales bacterium]|nr:2-C-methyl-D-erythritol 2,4-cyclodiphosphate synthase [Chitinivibrionales bacterium]MBD3396953.1 2-C-methyl-D-erythritol 2,4-cyclodiphosphate synthase [Chitinivibrionales bacterium]
MKTGIGQDSHRFEPGASPKPLRLGGITVPGCPGLAGNSDADVVLHALTNAVSGISGVNILGAVADDLCKNQGVTDSAEYLRRALDTLNDIRITHVSLSIECARPKLSGHIDDMKACIARILGIGASHIGITATSGEGLTSFGRGEGIQAVAIVTAQ